ncbi:preprotein translocase subunit SecA [Pseudofrankia saprophytica]|uniref:preprotein translocase subunit SecA n=1 Tax=Pseudofrankia saprophytica TaxID=298655 RepID=UPI000234C7F7|nr:preprotein translocase subunit SecA [Pseudofrankia saprophytica]
MVLDKILRAGEGRILRKLHAIAEQVNLIEDDFVGLSDAELRGMTDEFRQRLADDEETLDSLLPEAFATVREAARRTLGQRHFDVQIMGGAALHLGNISEMKTGEGKTLVSTLPAYLNALAGKGVHVITVNDYLAQRDAENMGRVHRFLGLSIGVIHPQMPPSARREQYACDVTYGTNNEFGFDYLRDNMAWSGEELVQRGHNFAIIDEADSILIDEARTPLIISGPADQPTRWYTEFARIAPLLIRDVDYEVEEGKRTVAITESGVEKVEDQLGIENLYESVNTPLVGYLNNSLKAKELYKLDKDYIVTDGEVLIVDEFTGRILHGRRYSEGMHQAIEAKEKVEIKQENQTLATITLQNYFRLYDKLSGMTGTAMTEAAEFHQTYKLGVVPIPTNKPMIRADQPDVVYKTEVAKFSAVVDDIVARHKKGQPVLVGTTSVEKSEYLSKQLTKEGVKHEVLNAKHHEREAMIIAEAGRRGAVTVATNMAGRGTDIMLGGNPEFIAQGELRSRGLSPLETPEDYEAAWPEALEKARSSVATEHDEVRELGGLYVLGTERHESRRIDNQLRGRAGRQGDSGESRFYLSLGDDLMRLFNASTVEGIMDRLQIPEDVPIESKIVTRAIRSAQTQVEGQNFEIRKNVLKYDEVMNKQRTVIYEERRKVLEGADLHEQVRHFVDDTIAGYVQGATAEGFAEEWDLDTLWTGLGQLYPVGVEAPSPDDRDGLSTDMLVEDIQTDAQDAYDRRETELGTGPDGEPVMRELERRVVLAVLDKKWREHLYEMDYLQEGIGLRAMGQRDPLVEYQREGYSMFQTMMEGIKEESVRLLFNVEVQVTGRDEEQGGQPAAGAAPTLGAPKPLAAVNPPAAERDVPPAAQTAPLARGGARTNRRAQGAGQAPARQAAPAPTPPVPTAPTPPPVFVKGLEPRRPSTGLQYSAPSVDGGPEPVTAYGRDGAGGGAAAGGLGGEPKGTARNAPCPCGSGRKYKRCHGDPARRG